MPPLQPPSRSRPAASSIEAPPSLPEKAAIVLAGARHVFMQHGFSAATTDMIQRAAGVSKSTVYTYFPNKEALFTAVVDRECDRFLQRIHEIEVAQGSISEKLMDLARAYLDVVLSDEAMSLFRVVVADAVRFPELARRFYLAGPEQMNTIVARILARASADRELDLAFAGADAASALLVNMIRGEAQMQGMTHPASKPSEAQRDQWASLAVRTFLKAFAPSSPALDPSSLRS